ncbi:MAG: hypothetical protein QM529_04845 [Hydrotalea sp.]|nr:hypothetical protein [Hydrotalea sp.]
MSSDKTYQKQHDEIQKIKKELYRLRDHIERNDKTHDVIVKEVVEITNFNKQKIAEFNKQSTIFIRWSFVLTSVAVALSLPHDWQVKIIGFISGLFSSQQ